MKLNTLMLRGLVRAAILLSGGVLSWGQVADGNLGGVVLDASGAAIRNAAVAIENIGTGLKSAAATDGVGRYQFNSLPVGHYRVTASAIGFQTVTLADITVELSRTASAYVTLPWVRKTIPLL
ncbi:MAG: carboxypeptidase-like regulatory domain-containing protein [Acidobacteriota bacterium]